MRRPHSHRRRPRFGQAEADRRRCQARAELGGSAAIFASQSAKRGSRVKVVGWVGNDSFRDLISTQLCAAGVEVSVLNRHQTLRTSIGVALSTPGDRAMLTYMGTIDGLRPSDIDQALFASCCHLHLASLFLSDPMRPEWPRWFALCRQRGITTSLDTNWDPRNRWEGAEELLIDVDVFLPNEQEALRMSREADIEKAGEKLAACGPLIQQLEQKTEYVECRIGGGSRQAFSSPKS